VVEPVVSSSRSHQQSFVGEPSEVDPRVIGKCLAVDFFFFASCNRAKKLDFAVRYVSEIGRELFLSEAAEDFIPVLCGIEFVAVSKIAFTYSAVSLTENGPR
jgi:hypothetical protein